MFEEFLFRVFLSKICSNDLTSFWLPWNFSKVSRDASWNGPKGGLIWTITSFRSCEPPVMMDECCWTHLPRIILLKKTIYPSAVTSLTPWPWTPVPAPPPPLLCYGSGEVWWLDGGPCQRAVTGAPLITFHKHSGEWCKARRLPSEPSQPALASHSSSWQHLTASLTAAPALFPPILPFPASRSPVCLSSSYFQFCLLLFRYDSFCSLPDVLFLSRRLLFYFCSWRARPRHISEKASRAGAGRIFPKFPWPCSKQSLLPRLYLLQNDDKATFRWTCQWENTIFRIQNTVLQLCHWLIPHKQKRSSCFTS